MLDARGTSQSTAATNVTLPNLIIAGVSKCGTTSLFNYLNLHPDVCGSDTKETLYFIPFVYGDDFTVSLKDYAHFFENCGGTRYVMEGSAGYFHGSERVAEAIRSSLGDIPIILIFRDPVRRFVSYYRYMIAHQHLSKDVNVSDYLAQCEAITPEQRHRPENDVYGALGGGYFDEYITPWIETFGDRLKVVFLEELIKDREAFMVDLAHWLGIDPTLFPFDKMDVENKSVNYKNSTLQRMALLTNDKLEGFWRRNLALKHALRSLYYSVNGEAKEQPIPEATIERLRGIYKPHNERFRDILTASGRTSLPTWLK